MNRKLIILLLLPLALSACGTVSETLGLDPQSGPDEFDVATAPPLAIPPDFTLRPPEPGAPRPQAVNPQTTAKELLTGSTVGEEMAVPTTNKSTAEEALLSNIESAPEAPAPEVVAPVAPMHNDITANQATDETTQLQAILSSPVTRNEPGKFPTIEMQDKGGAFWDSWF